MKFILKKSKKDTLAKAKADLVLVSVQVNGTTGMYQSHRWKNPQSAMGILKEDLKKQGVKISEKEELKLKDKKGNSVSEEKLLEDYQKRGKGQTLQNFVSNNYKVPKKQRTKTKNQIMASTWSNSSSNYITVKGTENSLGVEILEAKDRFIIKTPYNDDYRKQIKSLGARWESDLSAWTISKNITENPTYFYEPLIDNYGFSPTGRYIDIDVAVDGDDEFKLGNILIAKRSFRDSRPKVFGRVISGGFPDSGGSSKYPMLMPEENTVIRTTISVEAYDKLKEDKNNEDIIKNKGTGQEILKETRFNEHISTLNWEVAKINRKLDDIKEENSGEFGNISGVDYEQVANDLEQLAILKTINNLIGDKESFTKTMEEKCGSDYLEKRKEFKYFQRKVLRTYDILEDESKLDPSPQELYNEIFGNNKNAIEESIDTSSKMINSSKMTSSLNNQFKSILSDLKGQIIENNYSNKSQKEANVVIDTIDYINSKPELLNSGKTAEELIKENIDTIKNRNENEKSLNTIRSKDKVKIASAYGRPMVRNIAPIKSTHDYDEVPDMNSFLDGVKNIKDTSFKNVGRSALDMLGLYDHVLYVKEKGTYSCAQGQGVGGFYQVIQDGTDLLKRVAINEYGGSKVNAMSTLIHESMHAVIGKNAPAGIFGDSKDKRINESLVEISALYGTKEIMGEKKKVPSYLSYLIETMPQLKSMNEFKSVKNVQDLGKAVMEKIIAEGYDVYDRVQKHCGEFKSKDMSEYFNSYLSGTPKENAKKLETKKEKVKNLLPESTQKESSLDDFIKQVEMGTMTLEQAIRQGGKSGEIAQLFIYLFMDEDEIIDLNIPGMM